MVSWNGSLVLPAGVCTTTCPMQASKVSYRRHQYDITHSQISTNYSASFYRQCKTSKTSPIVFPRDRTRGLTCQTFEDGVPDSSIEAECIEIGIVGPPHGVKGEFKVQPLTDWPEERLGQKGTRYIKAPESTYHMARLQGSQNLQKVTLMRGRASVYKGREVWIVKLKGINTPEEAQTIHGHTLLVHESVRDELDDEDEFYIQQLIGLRVELLTNNDVVGTVVDIMDGTGTHDVLCVEHANTDATILLPFAKEIVPVVDITQGVLQITPPEGLLEMYQKKPKTEKKGRVRKKNM